MTASGKQFIVTEEIGKPLELFELLDEGSVEDFCSLSLKLLDTDHELTPKQLAKVAAKLQVSPDDLSVTIHALANLFLDFTKWQKKCTKKINTSGLETALVLSGVPHYNILIEFWQDQVWPKRGKVFLCIIILEGV